MRYQNKQYALFVLFTGYTLFTSLSQLLAVLCDKHYEYDTSSPLQLTPFLPLNLLRASTRRCVYGGRGCVFDAKALWKSAFPLSAGGQETWIRGALRARSIVLRCIPLLLLFHRSTPTLQ